jgi:hypothetical protein
MSARDAIIELEGENPAPSGHERRRAMTLAFVICVAVGSAVVGRDGPEATVPAQQPPSTVPANTTFIYSRDGALIAFFSSEDAIRAGQVVFRDTSSMIRVQSPEGAIYFRRITPTEVRDLIKFSER